MTNGNATSEGMPEAKPHHLRVIRDLDRDLIEPEYLQAHSVIILDDLEKAAEEADLALNWETVQIRVHASEAFTYLRAVADVL